MNEFIKQQKEKFIPGTDSDQYQRTHFIATALRNLHSSQHCSKCFTKDNECRMKIPNRECGQNTVIFQENFTP